VLLSFATQLLRKEGIKVPELELSKCWDTTIEMFNWQSEFIHSDTYWKIDVWKTGGLLLFPTTSTSSDMTQPADNIILITTRQMSKTVISNNDVVYYAADMQTQSTARDDKDQDFANQHNTIVIGETIYGEGKSSAYDTSKHFCRLQLRSRDDTCKYCEESLPSQYAAECEEAVEICYPSNPSTWNNGNQDPAPFSEGIIFNCGEMEIICPDEMECSHMVTQFNSGGYGTTVYANQETETYN